MTDAQLANIITVFSVLAGMCVALVAGYALGYQDAKRRLENK